MKKLISRLLLIILLFTIKVKSQILLNSESCFKIYMKEEFMINNSPSNYNINSFLIVNNTNEDYIINTRGFMEKSGEVYRNGERISPYLIMPFSESAIWTDEECKKNIVLIPAGKSINAILHLSILRGWYKIDDSLDYIVNFETEHTKKSPYYYGCRKYVDSLVNQRYKIYNGTLKGKIKLLKKK